jgi:hypothetical protein
MSLDVELRIEPIRACRSVITGKDEVHSNPHKK